MSEVEELDLGVLREDLKTAGEFLDALYPTNPRWGVYPANWIFRGQANADWPLLPKAARSTDAFARFAILGDASDFSQRAKMVNDLLQRFIDGLDRSGVPIPAPVPVVEELGVKEDPEGEPRRELFPVLALAQHHGLPTFLLDWSHRSHVAAYFAATDACNPETKGLGARLSVWGLRAANFVWLNTDPWAYRLLVYHAPAGTNPNLRAQAGVLTLLRGDPEATSFEPLESFVERITQRMMQPGSHGRLDGVFALRQMTLPVSEAPQLLRLLAYEGIDGAAMFPGADGVVRAMRERALQPLGLPYPRKVKS